jgi:hypothetical protein
MTEALFHCDDVVWTRFVALCRHRDETPGAVLRDLVRLEVQRCERRKAKSAEGIDERLLRRGFGFSSLKFWRNRKAGGNCRVCCAILACASRPQAAALS